MLLRKAHSVLLTSALLTLPTPALAGRPPPACIDHHEKSQELKLAGKLVESKQELLACASDVACPSVIQDECDKMLESLKRDIPSVVFAARDRNGQDTVDVEVYSGDRQLLSKLRVQAYDLDPGEYHFRFVASDGEEKRKTVVVREGEQNRRILVDFHTEPQPEPSANAASSPAVPASSGAWKRPTGFTLIGLGVIGVSVGSYFGLRAKSKYDDSRSDCDAANHCGVAGTALVNDAKSAATISTVSFAAGLASAAVGTLLVLTAPKSQEHAVVGVVPAVGPGYAGAAVTGRFAW